MIWNTHTVSQQRVENFPWTQKISTNLKYHLLNQMAGKAVKAYWAGKTRFRNIDTNLVDWSTIGRVVKSQTISMRTWTIKFTTGFCSTSHRMAQMKKHTTSACPHCSHLDDDTSHILQYPNPEAQTLWDGAILQLREHLKENDTDPGIIEDISAGIDAW